MYKVFALKYRPSTLGEVVGQPVAVKILKNAIKTGKVHHAILLSGPMGTGKTSLARIISKSLNCEKGPTVQPCGVCEACRAISAGKDVDVIEIDGASNRKVEDARAIIESVKYPPLKRRYKIYIIDEVHMLTQEAFNALLKTIEEPPDHVKFIFATTDIAKVPDTILSRCQILSLRRIPQEEIKKKLAFIAEKENIEIEESALELIAYASGGSLRVAEGYLDRCISYKPSGLITKDDVSVVLGISTVDLVNQYIENISAGNVEESIKTINMLYEESKDLETFCRQVIDNLIDKEMETDKKAAFLNIFYDALVNIKQKIDPLSSLLVATYKAKAVSELEKIDEIIKKLSSTSINIEPPTTSTAINKERKVEKVETTQANTINETTNQNYTGPDKKSAIDILLKTFNGKIINIEKIKR